MPVAAFPHSQARSTVDDVVTALLLLLTVVAVAVVGYLVLGGLRLQRDDVRIVADLVTQDRAAHDHHVDLLNKRMRAVEASAAIAEREARMVTLQMTDLNRVMVQQAEILATMKDGVKAQRGGTDSRRTLISPNPSRPAGGGQP